MVGFRVGGLGFFGFAVKLLRCAVEALLATVYAPPRL